jgi:mxaJ protein
MATATAGPSGSTAGGNGLPAELRVCADPNNLPFSNAAGEGFENALMRLLGDELQRPVRTTWVPQRRGFLRTTLEAGRCDIVPGIASGIGRVGTTQPVDRATYVFATRRGRAVPTSFDDPALRTLRIGVQLIGDDGANTPPMHALDTRGIQAAVGYPVYGDYRSRDPQAPIMDGLVRGDVDVAIVWGPVAGAYSLKHPGVVALAPVSPWLDGPQWPMRYDVSIGVRKDAVALRRALDRALVARRADDDALVATHGMAPPTESPLAAGADANAR